MKLRNAMIFVCVLGMASAAKAGVVIEEIDSQLLPGYNLAKYKKLVEKNTDTEIRLGKININQNRYSTVLLSNGAELTFKSEKLLNNDMTELSMSESMEQLYLTRTGDYFSGTFQYDGNAFTINSFQGGNYVYFMKKTESFNEEKDYVYDEESHHNLSQHGQRTELDVSSSVNSSPPSTPAKIRVLFVFGQDAASQFVDDNDIRQTAIARINESNSHLSASNVDDWAQFEYAGFHRWSRKESTRVYIPVDRYWEFVNYNISQLIVLAQHDSEVAVARNQVQADVIAIIGDDSLDRGCGLGKVAPSSENAYLAVESRCFRDSFALSHELGHIIGLRHNREDNSISLPYTYGHGHRSTTADMLTIMSYNTTPFFGARAFMFSNPDLNYPGTSIPAGTYTYENNARLIRERAHIVAGFR